MAEETDFAVQGSELPKGAGQQLAEAAELARAFREGSEPQMEPQAPAMVEVGSATEPMQPVYADVDDELDSELLGPTDFPGVPLSAGADYGAGSRFTRLSSESDDEFMGRIARQMLMAGRSVPEDARVWAARTLAGE